MTPPPDLPPALRALLETAGALVRQSSSGRVALGRVHDLVPDGALTERALRPLREAREASAEPLTAKAVEQVLKGAWGRPPGKVLDELDREPLAVRPAAQVHRAVLDGEPVAVKVRRPGLASAVRSDLALLDALAPPLRGVVPTWDARPLLREARESALDELDLEHEASTARAARRALRGVEGLVLPAVHGEHCADDVLVTALLDGPTLAEAQPDDAEAVAHTLLVAHVRAARAGLALTDPRPGHVVLLRGGEVGLLGAGVARPVPRERTAAWLDLLGALRDDDERSGVVALDALGLPPDAFGLARDVLGELVAGSARLDVPALAGLTERALDRIGPGLKLAAATTPHPADLAIGRGLGQLIAVLAPLGVTLDWPRAALAA